MSLFFRCLHVLFRFADAGRGLGLGLGGNRGRGGGLRASGSASASASVRLGLGTPSFGALALLMRLDLRLETLEYGVRRELGGRGRGFGGLVLSGSHFGELSGINHLLRVLLELLRLFFVHAGHSRQTYELGRRDLFDRIAE